MHTFFLHYFRFFHPLLLNFFIHLIALLITLKLLLLPLKIFHFFLFILLTQLGTLNQTGYIQRARLHHRILSSLNPLFIPKFHCFSHSIIIKPVFFSIIVYHFHFFFYRFVY